MDSPVKGAGIKNEPRYNVQCKEIDGLIDALFTKLAPVSLPNSVEEIPQPEQIRSKLNTDLEHIAKRLSQLLQEIDY